MDSLIKPEAYGLLLDEEDEFENEVEDFYYCKANGNLANRLPKKLAQYVKVGFIPRPDDLSIHIATYTSAKGEHFPNILYKIKQEVGEPMRYDVTEIVNRWLTLLEGERWISLNCIGASKYFVSSYGRFLDIKGRTLWKQSLQFGYFMVMISFDNAKSYDNRGVKMHNLVAAAFYEFPHMETLTVDHEDRNPRNNLIDNLSWQTKSVQCQNQDTKFKVPFPVYQIDQNNNIIKDWGYCNEMYKYPDYDIQEIERSCRKGTVYHDSYWRYYEEPIENEEFRLIQLDGLENVYCSNMGRIKLSSGLITRGSLSLQGYRTVGLYNTEIEERKNYPVHVLIALTWIPNPYPLVQNIVNHINSVRHDNQVPNLEWVTQSSNVIHGCIRDAFTNQNVCQPVKYVNEQGQVLAIYYSRANASDQTKTSKKIIYRQCKENKTGEAGFRFVYDIKKNKLNNIKPVVQTDFAGNKLWTWVAAAVAADLTGIDVTSILLCCRGTYKSAGGYLWRFLELHEAPRPVHLIPDIKQLQYRSNEARKEGGIYELNADGDIKILYETLTAASAATNVSSNSIRTACKSNDNGAEVCGHIFAFPEKYNSPGQVLRKASYTFSAEGLKVVKMNLEGYELHRFNSLKEAATDALNVSDRTTNKITPAVIKRVCDGARSRIGLFRYAYESDFDTDPEKYKILPPKLKLEVEKLKSGQDLSKMTINNRTKKIVFLDTNYNYLADYATLSAGQRATNVSLAAMNKYAGLEKPFDKDGTVYRFMFHDEYCRRVRAGLVPQPPPSFILSPVDSIEQQFEQLHIQAPSFTVSTTTITTTSTTITANDQVVYQEPTVTSIQTNDQLPVGFTVFRFRPFYQ